jgi:hypothetical protein
MLKGRASVLLVFGARLRRCRNTGQYCFVHVPKHGGGRPILVEPTLKKGGDGQCAVRQ